MTASPPRGGRLAAWRSNCTPNEHVIFDGHPSWRGTLSFYLRGVLGAAAGAVVAALITAIGSGFSWTTTSLVFLVLSAIVILVGFLYRMTTTYTITNQRLTIRRGILSRHLQQTRVERVQNVNVDQSVIDRVMRVGQVDFDTAGARRLRLHRSAASQPRTTSCAPSTRRTAIARPPCVEAGAGDLPGGV